MKVREENKSAFNFCEGFFQPAAMTLKAETLFPSRAARSVQVSPSQIKEV